MFAIKSPLLLPCKVLKTVFYAHFRLDITLRVTSSDRIFPCERRLSEGSRKDSHVEAYLGNSIYSFLPLSKYILSLIAQRSFWKISYL
jgi:hypothetical protein